MRNLKGKQERKMKKYIFTKAALLGALLCLSVSCKAVKEEQKVVVYSYSSFAGEWGAGPAVAKLFEEETGIKVDLVPFDGAESVYLKALSEKDSPEADVLIGLDATMTEKVKSDSLTAPYKPREADKLFKEAAIDPSFNLIPFDYGIFAFMFDSESNLEKPSSLEALKDSKYKGKIAIPDPRTSSVGRGLAEWVKAVYGEKAGEWWQAVRENILTMPQSWSASYALFKKGEVPLSLSYTTSLSAHVLYDKTERFQPLIFDEGHVLQVEMMGLVKNAPHSENGKKFINFMLTDKVQKMLCETQFMFPVREGTALPESFKGIPNVKNILKSSPLNEEELQGAVESLR